MAISEEHRTGLNVALNEATWLDTAIEEAHRRVVLALSVLSLPTDEAAHTESSVSVILLGVTRIVASLRAGLWNDESADVLPLDIPDLPHAVRSFGGCPIYGWEFIDPADGGWNRWRNRLSADVRLSDDPAAHVIELFQEGGLDAPRHLDVRVWFDNVAIYRQDNTELPLHEFIASGERWWDAMYAGDPRTSSSGIFPLATESQPPVPPFSRGRRRR